MFYYYYLWKFSSYVIYGSLLWVAFALLRAADSFICQSRGRLHGSANIWLRSWARNNNTQNLAFSNFLFFCCSHCSTFLILHNLLGNKSLYIEREPRSRNFAIYFFLPLFGLRNHHQYSTWFLVCWLGRAICHRDRTRKWSYPDIMGNLNKQEGENWVELNSLKLPHDKLQELEIIHLISELFHLSTNLNYAMRTRANCQKLRNWMKFTKIYRKN